LFQINVVACARCDCASNTSAEATMSHTPHEIAEEFPEHAALIAVLKQEDAHFARLCQEYHDVNRAVHRAETLVEPVAESHEQDLRRARLRLKDEIHTMLTAAAAA
jgi:uncharacterized protein YdcH (DUF465 family)